MGRGEWNGDRGGLAIPSQLMSYTVPAHINHTLHLYVMKIIEWPLFYRNKTFHVYCIIHNL